MSYLPKTYLRWQDLHPHVPTQDEIFYELSKLDRLGVLLLLCRLNIHQYLDAVQRDSGDAIALQGFLLCNLFSSDIIELAKAKFGTSSLDEHKGVHLQQTLTLLKWAVLHGAISGGLHPDSGASALESVGKCLLMTSDQLFSPEMRAATKAAQDAPTPEAYLDILLTSWSGIEVNNPPAVKNSFVRSEMIFRELVKHDTSFLQIADEFGSKTGLTLDAYLDMNFGLISYFYLQTQKKLIDDAGAFALNPETFFREMNATDAARFWQMESVSVELLEDALRVPSDLKSYNDFAALRVKPFLAVNDRAVLCVNPGFVQEKLEMGLFWAIANQLKGKARKQLFVVWGDLFQRYMSWLLNSAIDGLIEKFYPFPKFEQKRSHHESFDAVLISETCCAVIECKGGFLKGSSKYAENREDLIQDLDLKFGTAEPKAAVAQLVRKIGQVFDLGNSDKRTLEGIDCSRIEQIIPVLVLQDRCASSFLAAPWLGQRFVDEMKMKNVVPSVPCAGLVVVNIEELETLRPFVMAGQVSFIDCLRERIQLGDPSPGKRLIDFSNAIDSLLARKNIQILPPDDFDSRFEAILDRVSRRFFGRPVHEQ